MRPTSALLLAFGLVAATVHCGDEGDASAGSGGGTTDGAGGYITHDASTGAGGAPNPNVIITTSPCSADRCAVRFEGSGFDSLEGMTVYWGIEEYSQPQLLFQDSATITNGAFVFSETMAVPRGLTVSLNYFVDVDDDMACSPSPTDEVWRVDLSTVRQDLLVEVAYDPARHDDRGCTGF